MRTRIIQDDPAPQTPPQGASQVPEANGITSRDRTLERDPSQDGHHRLARLRRRPLRPDASGVLKTERLTPAEEVAGERRRCRADPRRRRVAANRGAHPDRELEDLTARIPSSRRSSRHHQGAPGHRARRERRPGRRNAASVSDDGHSALVEFEVKGGDGETSSTNLAASATGHRGSQGRVSGLQDRSVRWRLRREGDRRHDPGGRRQGRHALAADHARGPPRSLSARSSRRASRSLLALTSVLATMGMVAIPSQLFALSGNTDALILLIGLAVGVDYSLFYMRREREERAAGRIDQGRDRGSPRPPPAGPS